jgi:uncharacterized membrane protein required for colicin V production
MSDWLDYVLLIVLLAGLTVGYVQGLLRQVINLAAMYLAAILAAQYFHVLGNFLKSQLATTPGTLLNAASFFLVMFAVTALLNFLTFDAYKNTKLTLFPLLDRVGGMILGVIASWILITLAISVLAAAASTQYWASGEHFRQMLKDGIQGSQIALVTESTLPNILGAIKPWLPTGLPAIFDI